MSDVIATAVASLRQKLSDGFDAGTAKFVIPGEGAIMVDASGVRVADEEADVTLTAEVDTFRGMLSGEISPTSAYMSGRLSVDGDLGLAMKLGSALA